MVYNINNYISSAINDYYSSDNIRNTEDYDFRSELLSADRQINSEVPQKQYSASKIESKPVENRITQEDINANEAGKSAKSQPEGSIDNTSGKSKEPQSIENKEQKQESNIARNKAQTGNDDAGTKSKISESTTLKKEDNNHIHKAVADNISQNKFKVISNYKNRQSKFNDYINTANNLDIKINVETKDRAESNKMGRNVARNSINFISIDNNLPKISPTSISEGNFILDKSILGNSAENPVNAKSTLKDNIIGETSSSLLNSANLENKQETQPNQRLNSKHETISEKSSQQSNNFDSDNKFESNKDNSKLNQTQKNLQIAFNGQLAKADIVETKTGTEIIMRNIEPSEFSSKTLRIINSLPSNSVSTAKMTLKPPHLGTIIVDIKVENDKVFLNVKVEGKDILRAIENQLPLLREKLIQSGLKPENIELSDKDNKYDNENGDLSKHNSGNDKEKENLLREFIRTFNSLFEKNSNEILNEPAVSDGLMNLTSINNGRKIK